MTTQITAQEFVPRIRDAATRGDTDALDEVACEIAESHINPEEPRLEKIVSLVRGVRSFAVFAYMADHPGQPANKAQGAYADQNKYGTAMKMATELCDREGLDIREILSERKIGRLYREEKALLEAQATQAEEE